VVNLEAVSPCQDLLPITIGSVSLTEIILPMGKVWSVSPSPVQAGQSKATKTNKTLWIGRDHALQIGVSPPKAGTITDQSDAWACVAIGGQDVDAVLARLCPVNLSKMDDGEVARTLINHLTAIILATSEGYEVFVFRAFARTLVHELQEAANGVLGRAELRL
jgi:hypothetical protein